MRGWLQDLGDLVLPAECGGCGRPRTTLCARCGDALCGGAPRRVRPNPEPPGLPVVHAAAPYQDAVRAVLLAHKERGALGLAEPLGAALAGAVRAGLGEAGDGGGGGGGGPVDRRTRAAGRPQADAHTPRDMRTQTGGVRTPVSARTQAGVRNQPGARPQSTARDQPGARAQPTARNQPGARAQPTARNQPGARAQPTARPEPTPPPAPPTPLLLIPVPSARKAVRARGHDPSRRIAYAAAAELRRVGVPARVCAALRQRRVVADQAGLNSRRRLANLSEALEVPAGARALLAAGGRIVLVDDVMTTGASLAEAARAIRAAVAGTAEGESDGITPRWVETARELPARNSISAAVVAASPSSFEINRN
ncbi:ComF family protein [Streptomyces sp. NPDC017964]|uniref:ComF family protein n=1 Tax=Streptomyces sp. NPDC017964 TaxID=3365022 RepID=UPI0037B94051